jgi:hypothetical protein
VECGFDFHNLEWVEWIAAQKSPTEFNQSGRTVTTGGWQSLVPSARE